MYSALSQINNGDVYALSKHTFYRIMKQCNIRSYPARATDTMLVATYCCGVTSWCLLDQLLPNFTTTVVKKYLCALTSQQGYLESISIKSFSRGGGGHANDILPFSTVYTLSSKGFDYLKEQGYIDPKTSYDCLYHIDESSKIGRSSRLLHNYFATATLFYHINNTIQSLETRLSDLQANLSPDELCLLAEFILSELTSLQTSSELRLRNDSALSLEGRADELGSIRTDGVLWIERGRLSRMFQSGLNLSELVRLYRAGQLPGFGAGGSISTQQRSLQSDQSDPYESLPSSNRVGRNISTRQRNSQPSQIELPDDAREYTVAALPLPNQRRIFQSIPMTLLAENTSHQALQLLSGFSADSLSRLERMLNEFAYLQEGYLFIEQDNRTESSDTLRSKIYGYVTHNSYRSEASQANYAQNSPIRSRILFSCFSARRDNGDTSLSRPRYLLPRTYAPMMQLDGFEQMPWGGLLSCYRKLSEQEYASLQDVKRDRTGRTYVDQSLIPDNGAIHAYEALQELVGFFRQLSFRGNSAVAHYVLDLLQKELAAHGAGQVQEKTLTANNLQSELKHLPAPAVLSCIRRLLSDGRSILFQNWFLTCQLESAARRRNRFLARYMDYASRREFSGDPTFKAMMDGLQIYFDPVGSTGALMHLAYGQDYYRTMVSSLTPCCPLFDYDLPHMAYHTVLPDEIGFPVNCSHLYMKGAEKEKTPNQVDICRLRNVITLSAEFDPSRHPDAFSASYIERFLFSLHRNVHVRKTSESITHYLMHVAIEDGRDAGAWVRIAYMLLHPLDSAVQVTFGSAYQINEASTKQDCYRGYTTDQAKKTIRECFGEPLKKTTLEIYRMIMIVDSIEEAAAFLLSPAMQNGNPDFLPQCNSAYLLTLCSNILFVERSYIQPNGQIAGFTVFHYLGDTSTTDREIVGGKERRPSDCFLKATIARNADGTPVMPTLMYAHYNVAKKALSGYRPAAELIKRRGVFGERQ